MSDEFMLEKIEEDEDFIHSNQRLNERYNIQITPLEYLAIIDSIQGNNKFLPKIFFKRRSNRVSGWIIYLKNRWLALYYDNKRKRIRTFLTDDTIKRYLDLINDKLKGNNQMIHRCENCKPHKFQDEMYGYKMRVFNVNTTYTKANCTVCGTTIQLSSSEIKNKRMEIKQNV